MALYSEVLSRIFLGITLAAPIGPVSIEMIQRGLKKGFLSAFVVRLGAAVGNFLCLLLSYYGFLQLNKHSFIIIGLSILGSLLLIHRGYLYVSSKIESISIENSETISNGILTGFYLSIANPIAFIFWAGIMANSSNTISDGIAFNLLIILGVIIWGIIFSLILSIGKTYITAQTLLRINKIAGIIMLYYGITFLCRGVATLIF